LKRKVNAVSFTPKYDSLEDRIRLSINYDDIQNRVDFMITRSLILKLFPLLDEYMFKYYDIELTSQSPVAPSIKEQIKENKTTSATDGANLELYKQEDELLEEISFSYIASKKLTVLNFKSKNSEAIAKLDANLIKQVFAIIKSSIPFFSWGISHNL